MSELILPESVKANGFIAGRKLKRCEDLFQFFGQLVFLRHPTAEVKIPRVKDSGYVGILHGFAPDPAYPKRAGGLFLLGSHAPAAFAIIETKAVEESDPWVCPPGFPERAVSMLEE